MRLSGPARVSLRVLLLMSSLLIASSTAALAQEFDATALTAPSDLAAGWRVQAGDDPAFASLSFDDSRWLPFDAHDSINKIIPNRPPVVWYRLRVKVRPGQEGLALREWALEQAFEIYVNGRRVRDLVGAHLKEAVALQNLCQEGASIEFKPCLSIPEVMAWVNRAPKQQLVSLYGASAQSFVEKQDELQAQEKAIDHQLETLDSTK